MSKLILVRPGEEHINEIRAYRDEWRAHDTHSHGDSGLYKKEDIADWVNFCRLMKKKETAPNPKWVEADQFMLMREGEPRILGMINFRHYLNDGYVSEHSGHIGYGVRPSERRKGYAKAMLALCLEEARACGLDKVLVCCDLDNAGSRSTIKACGGKFERLAITGAEVDERYWIYLGGSPESHSHTPGDAVLLDQSQGNASPGHSQPQNTSAPEGNHLDNFYSAREEEAAFPPATAW